MPRRQFCGAAAAISLLTLVRAMLLFLLDWLSACWPASELAALERITPRAALAAAASFVLAIACGRRMIRWLAARFREPNKSASPDVERLHQAKAATPTMGGLFIVSGILGSCALVCDWHNPYLPITLGAVAALTALGACDDLVKLRTARRGLKARTKLIVQTAIALVAAVLIYRVNESLLGGLDLVVPFTGRTLALGWWFVPLAAVTIVGSSNAVNLADGLDGLAGGCMISAGAALAVVTYAAGQANWSAYLNVPHVPGAGELTVVAAAMLGGVLGFLWFNCHPASVFMGDTGSLPLGGLLGLLAVIARAELLLVAIGGVFVAEAGSVILQVAGFRLTKKRIFRCAPLHHHFQLGGWPEDKVVVRFWIAAALCALVGLTGLQGRSADVPAKIQLTAIDETSR